MWGRKDKKKDRQRAAAAGEGGGGRGAGLPIMGFGMPSGGDVSEEALEAELLAMQGKSPNKGKKKGSKVNMQDIDSMVAGLEGIGEEGDSDDGEGGDLSDMDDDDLLSELQDIAGDEEMEEEEEEEATPPPPRRPHNGSAPSRAAKPSPQLSAVEERLAMYEKAVALAKEKGESSKVRRYSRALDSIKTIHKQVKAGKSIDVDDLPPPVLVPGGGGGPQQTTTAPPSGGRGPKDPEISDDELMAWADSSSSVSSQPAAAPPILPSSHPPTVTPSQPNTAQEITERLQLYQKAVKEAEEGGDSGKSRRYKRSITTIQQMLKAARAGKPVDLSELPPTVAVKSVSDKALPSPPKPTPLPRSSKPSPPPPQPKPRPQQTQAPPIKSDGLIDLDAPEFDEFNLTDEDMAMLAAQLQDDRVKSGSGGAGPPPAPSSSSAPSSSPRTPSSGIQVLPPPPSRRPLHPTSSSHPSQSLPPSLPPTTPTKEDVHSLLLERKDQYLASMRQAKAQGAMSKARDFGKMAATFNRIVKAFDQGQPVDLTQMPPPPPGFRSKYNFDLSKFTPAVQAPQPAPVVKEMAQGAAPAISQADEAEPVEFSVPTPKTVMEALEQRLAKYRETQRLAEEKEESSRARRMGRIVKQYEEAIKSTKAKKPYDYSQLPDPPGYPPIPVPHLSASPRASLGGGGGMGAMPRPTQSLPVPPPSQQRGGVGSGSKFMPNPVVSQDQLSLLTQRHQELLRAVKEAKGRGDKEEALHYLRLYKGLEKMIEAAKGGLPVDLSQVPPSPYTDVSSSKPSAAVLSHLKPASEGDDKTFDRIKSQLQRQIDMCNDNSKTYEELGNTGTATQYLNMSRDLQKELLAIEGIQSQGLCPPRFTMETRKFTIVHSHQELSSHQCEVEVVKAVSLPKPQGYEERDMNVYVEVEFPWPTDNLPKSSSDTVKETANPEFNFKDKFEIDRKVIRSILRTLKRNPVKCVVWQKRTLRRDIFIGQALFSIDKLENKSEVRTSLDLMDEKGRKPAGGKMDVVARLREPLTGRDTEDREEQWLVFQESIAVVSSAKMPKPPPPSSPSSSSNTALLSPAKVENTTSVEALKVELSLVQSAIKAGHKDQATVHKGRQIQARIQVIRQRLQTDAQFRAVYPRQVAKEIQMEQTLEQKLVQAGRTREAKVLQARRSSMQQEIKTLSGRK